MKLHPRREIVTKAKLELQKAILVWSEAHALTQIEIAQILAAEVEDALKYALRFERHGNYNKQADEA